MSDKTIKICALLALAIIVGCIYIYPDMKLIHELKSNYHGITMTATNDELKYLGSINAFYKGKNFTLSGFDNYEHRGQPWTFGFFPGVFLGTIGKLLRISVVNLDILMSFILPAVLFVLVFSLTFRFCESMSLSLLSSASVLLGYDIFTGRPSLLKSIFNVNYPKPLLFLRPISPQFNHILLILSLLLIYKSLNSEKKSFLWISSLALGLLFYSFMYSWTFIYAGLLVLVIIFMIKKEFVRIRKIIFIFLVSFVISIPYWINCWRLIHLSDYHYLEYLNKIIYTHKPITPLFHILLTSFILLSYFRKKIDFTFWYITSFLIGGLICLNQQIISGKILYPGHWLGYSNKTFLIIALFASFKNFKESYFINKITNITIIRRSIICLSLSFLFILAFNQQANFYEKNKNFYFQKQSLSPVFSWLRQNTGGNDVILTDPFNYPRGRFPEYDDVLVYSNNFAFLPVSAGTVRSKEELEDRFIISLVLFSYSAGEAQEFFEYNNGVLFICMGAVKEYGGGGIQPEYVNHLKEKFNLFQNEQVLFSKLKNYRLDYIIVSKNIRLQEMLRKFDKNLRDVYGDKKFVILKYQPK